MFQPPSQTLFEAMTRLDGDLRLLVVGGDQHEPENGHAESSRARASAPGLGDRVRLLWAQRQERLRVSYAAATVIRSYHESFGNLALEAMACGSPVMASRLGGLTTTMRDGVTSYLVPEVDPAALADRLARLLGDATIRERLGREATQWAAEHRWPCVAEAVCRLSSEFEPVASAFWSARCLARSPTAVTPR